MLTQIICGDICKNIGQMAHDVKKRLQIPFQCTCCRPNSQKPTPNDTFEISKRVQSNLAENPDRNIEAKSNQVSKHKWQGCTSGEF